MNLPRPLNARQRAAWLVLLAFLALTAALFYYLFEISDSYNAYALDHVSHHTRGEITGVHLADLPLAAWMLVALVPYLQVFAMLLACTKPQPMQHSAFLWPVTCYAALCRRRVSGGGRGGGGSAAAAVPLLVNL